MSYEDIDAATFRELHPEGVLELGGGQRFRLTEFDGYVVGGVREHPRGPGDAAHAEVFPMCASSYFFDTPAMDRFDPHRTRPRWRVESLEPLTLTPSLVCTICGDHGSIRGGQWVPVS